MRLVLIAAAVSLAMSAMLTPLLAKWLRNHGLAQAIRKSSETVHFPDHEVKVGTPSMGGAAILVSLITGYVAAHLVTLRPPTYSAFLAIALTVGLGAVGVADDYLKIFKQRSTGIRARTKLIGQAVAALAFAVAAMQNPFGDVAAPASLAVSFVRDLPWVLPAGAFLVWVWFLVTATTNGVNLADGLDGLASGAALMSFGAYTLLSVWQYGQSCYFEQTPGCYLATEPFDLAVFAAAFGAAIFGFLWFNTSPARIFMGDTGSLAMGGGIAALAVMTRTELLLPFFAGLFVLVSISSIIQVGYFKATGKRFFLMAPLHHHFELKGWPEVTIVVRFWMIQAVAVIGGLAIFYAEWVKQ